MPALIQTEYSAGDIIYLAGTEQRVAELLHTLAGMRRLTFEEPDLETFRCLALAYEALAAGGTAPACLNAANEIAVQAFLDGRIGFLDIARVIEESLAAIPAGDAADIESIIATDAETRIFATSCAARSAVKPPGRPAAARAIALG